MSSGRHTLRHAVLSALGALSLMWSPYSGFGQSATPQQIRCTHVKGAAGTGDEVVLGVDGTQLFMLVHPTEAPLDWEGADTRMATLDGAPWRAVRPEVWGTVPQQAEAWKGAGRIIHLDIDPLSGMAVLTAMAGGKSTIWLSARSGEDTWSEPWKVPALEAFDGLAAFAGFDGQQGREGDILVALRPNMEAREALPQPSEGVWKGGYDMARIHRLGGYSQWTLLDPINTAGDEMSLVAAPGVGGWLSAERLGGEGGLDVWWCPEIPEGSKALPAAGEGFLTGHKLEVRCGSERIKGLSWQVTAEAGFPVCRAKPDAEGAVDLSMLEAGRSYAFNLLGRPPEFCRSATAEWRDERGQLVRRFNLGGSTWSLSFIATLALPGWSVMGGDQSELPEVADRLTTDRLADWIVFHDLGAVGVTKEDRDQLKAFAGQLAARPSDVVLIVGHASSDGEPEANAVLAAERARHVAAQLEFAGLPSSQIRFEGKGDLLPMEACPPGVACPEGSLARSRRTELYIRIGTRADGGPMQ